MTIIVMLKSKNICKFIAYYFMHMNVYSCIGVLVFHISFVSLKMNIIKRKKCILAPYNLINADNIQSECIYKTCLLFSNIITARKRRNC